MPDAERFEEFPLFGAAGGREDLCARALGQLNRRETDATGGLPLIPGKL